MQSTKVHTLAHRLLNIHEDVHGGDLCCNVPYHSFSKAKQYSFNSISASFISLVIIVRWQSIQQAFIKSCQQLLCECGKTSLSEYSKNNMVQFRHCSALNPENSDDILVGIRPTSSGVSTFTCMASSSFHTFIILCLALPNKRLCMGSIIHSYWIEVRQFQKHTISTSIFTFDWLPFCLIFSTSILYCLSFVNS